MKQIIITAGPTVEAIDPVRFLSNRSSGKMGYALAEAATKLFTVTLITGPTNLPHPKNCQIIEVTSAAEMHEKVLELFPKADALIMCAAVADYTPIAYATEKLKKSDDDLVIKLKRTKDILRSVAKIKQPHQRVMGFAAETQNLQENAQNKLKKKSLDWIAANDVSRSDIGFGSNKNAVKVFSKNTVIDLEIAEKSKIAQQLVEIIANSYDQ